jgi:hypothetical protein
MKNIQLQWLASFMALGIFVWMAVASIGPIDFGEAELKKETIAIQEDGGIQYKERTLVKSFAGDPITEETVGSRDRDGKWHGLISRISIIFDHEDPKLEKHKEIEVGTYIHGKRHGKFKRDFYENGILTRFIEMTFHMGELIISRPTYGNLSKNDNSAFSILSDRYPWFLYAFHSMDIGGELVEPYMNALEAEISLGGFDADVWDDEHLWMFEEAYDIALEALSEDENYNKLINYHNLITVEEATDIVRGNEFRMAVLDRHRSGATHTFEILSAKYPGYTSFMFQAETEEGLFETFCGMFDEQMDGLGPLDQEDPFFIDSLDQRMAATLFAIMFSEKSFSDLYREASELAAEGKYCKYHNLAGKFKKMVPEDDIEMRPQDFGFVVFYRFMLDMQKGDLVRRAMRDKFFANCEKPALVTTYAPESITGSVSSVTGYVIEDGGADVTERGIVWGIIYNPTKEENVVVSGSGKGEFTVSLSILGEGQTFYARAYAINSVGIAYGNVVQLQGTGGGTTSIPIDEKRPDAFRVFPVPARDFLKVSLVIQGCASISLVNMNGQVVRNHIIKDSGEQEVIFNTDGLLPGIYFVRLNNENQTTTKKVIIE